MNIKNVVKNFSAKTLPQAVGGVACGMSDQIIPQGLNPKIKGLIKLGVGALLPEFVKSKFVEQAAAGWNGVAGLQMAGAFGLPVGMAGIGEVGAYIEEDYMTGMEEENDITA